MEITQHKENNPVVTICLPNNEIRVEGQKVLWNDEHIGDLLKYDENTLTVKMKGSLEYISMKFELDLGEQE